MTRRLLLASHNPGKLVELRRILGAAGLDVQLLSVDDVGPFAEVPETGATFAENALLKARAAAAATGVAAVADDSGLCVDALNGMPGVLSARGSGRHGDDEANLRLLLGQLADIPDERRGAQFVCAAAYVDLQGHEVVVEGRVAGTLTRAPAGENGFGYDPVFVPTGEQLTTAQMSAEAKDAISHRGRAFRALAERLRHEWPAG